MTESSIPCEQAFILSQEDFDRFARLSGDHNPIHVDPEFSARTSFGRTVSHGMLLFSVVRSLLAQSWPRSVLKSQSLMFPAPAYAGDTLELVIEETGREGRTLTLTTTITRPDGETCLAGQCELQLSEEEV
ncbi:MaoC like domain-containing protein [Marinobacter daqiaonensis]|uniref:MaoC like domain-containing protein n=1 Tax=Marinobacter daqiaonensis TaxID=650891 RepID=A0A1I6INV3_9GAMM|nr:MaoC family dehydratase [Marinobacter daqiaonensis]SFR68425.1 MaoC like domain-containing protein [Marinobacter daqiaonensis]